MAPSSSGPGRLVLIQKIAGSTPAGVTNSKNDPLGSFLNWSFLLEWNPQGSHRAKRDNLSRRSHQNKKEAPTELVFYSDTTPGRISPAGVTNSKMTL